MFDVYTGIYNDLRNTIFYLQMLQAPHSTPVCGMMCGMHVSFGFVDKISRHIRPETRYGTLPRGSRDLYEMLPICIHIPYDAIFWPTMQGTCQPQSDEISDSENTHQHAAAIQVGAPDTALQSVVEDMKTIL